jgi:hypothetical protein
MRPDDPNYEYLFLVADALGDLRNDVVFDGGCTAGLLLTDLAAEPIRATKDVDAIVEAATLGPRFTTRTGAVDHRSCFHMVMPLSNGWPRILRSASAGGSVARTSGRCGRSIAHGLHRRFARRCLANLPSFRFLRPYQENPQLEPRVGNCCTLPTACPP